MDTTADYVLVTLEKRGVEVARFDIAWFPAQASLVARLDSGDQDMDAKIMSSLGRSVNLQDVASVLYAKPRDFAFDESLDPDARKFARGESLMGLGGVLRSTACRWVNHPEKLATANYKPLQLTVASRIGLPIPRTLITNDPAAARDFVKSAEGGAIYKTLFDPDVPSDTYALTRVFTSRVSLEDLDTAEMVRYAPCLLQDFVPKAFEVRVVVIGRRVFAVALTAPEPGAVVDWRPVTKTLKYSPHQMPAAVEERIVRLVREFGLMFAVLDLVVTPENEYVFLELNPGGQWGWLEAETGLPMTEALADCLAPFSAARSDRPVKA
jgi:glutathione synthase/RimK-type ligase-like ATP-grasp enzyme